MSTSAPPVAGNNLNHGNANYGFALSALTSLFFMWGLITSLNDILIPKLKAAFDLSYTEASLIQFCFFFAYFVVSVPAGVLVKRVGYKTGIVIGLLIAAVGCVGFYPSADSQSYPLFLGSLFVLASGITILQVAANPYVTILGAPKTASSRLTLTQAFNSLGTTVGPILGGMLILSEAATGVEAAVEGAKSVQMPYLGLAGILVLLAVVMSVLRLPQIEAEEDEAAADDGKSAWSYSHLVLGAVGIFVYVGAEVSIGSYLVNFFGEANIAGMPEHKAANMVAYYWGGAMVGRFIGAAAMQKIAAGKALAFNALMASLLVALAATVDGHLAMWAIIAVGLFNSIMFPTIFSLGVAGLGRHTSQGSGVLCLAIVGGAVIPVLHGMLIDNIGIHSAFYFPALLYLYIIYYGLVGSKQKS